MKLYTFRVPDEASSGRLFSIAKRMLPETPEWALRAAFDKRDVKQNGQRANRQTALVPGAEVKVYLSNNEERPLLTMLYQDEDLLIVRKPAGISCQQDAKGGKTVTQLAAAMLRKERPDAPEPLLCHRLDNQTEGLMLLAKNPLAQQGMEEGFRQHRIHKCYLCMVKGTPQPAKAILRAWLKKDEQKARVRVLNREAPDAVPIVTEYQVLEAGERSRLSIVLHTGRTHQIRAQMAAIGHPVIGDDQYGDRAFNRQWKSKRLMLCAVSLSFSLEGPWAYMNEKHFTIDPSF